MVINELLNDKNMSRYKLSKISGVPQTTITDICSGKTSMEKCSAGTLYKIAKALDVSMESLLESKEAAHRKSFEVFKSNVCHIIKDNGEIEFIINTLESNKIRQYYDKKWYLEAYYTLGMVDYLSRKNDIPYCSEYSDLRKQKLSRTVYSSGTILRAAIMNDDNIKKKAEEEAIPEFKRFGIIESEVNNVV